MRKLSRLLAGGVAGAVCLALAGGAAAPARAAGDKKARERAERTLRAGDFQEAERMYREVLAKDARDQAARLGLSHALLKQRKHLDAFDHAARVDGASGASTTPTSARLRRMCLSRMA